MQPHEQRVVEEEQELQGRIVKLASFISGSPVFASLPEIDQNLLREQRTAMIDYQRVLTKRIKRFAA